MENRKINVDPQFMKRLSDANTEKALAQENEIAMRKVVAKFSDDVNKQSIIILEQSQLIKNLKTQIKDLETEIKYLQRNNRASLRDALDYLHLLADTVLTGIDNEAE